MREDRTVSARFTTGFLHPGAMGSSLAGACAGERIWASSGRSPATAARAEDAGLIDVGTLDALVAMADVIVSICPPDQARAVAESVAGVGFGGVYVDANAISPATARDIAGRFERFVDGGVIGPPAQRPGTTRLYLSGDGAEAVAERWAGSMVGTRVVDGGPGAASALKMAYAAWTKGSSALLLAVNALAGREGVAAVLDAEWAISQPGLVERSHATVTGVAAKAWRFAGEMDEIADTFAAAGLPDGFHRAAGDVYRRLTSFKDGSADLDAVIDALADG
jgi:3-hydroxyisobutyrate dehydrogenase-like beta-hydroxyacid dehydrogenase